MFCPQGFLFGSRERQVKMLQLSFVAVWVEAALGWVPFLEVAQVARGFPSAASRARLVQLLQKFGLSEAEGFGSQFDCVSEPHFTSKIVI